MAVGPMDKPTGPTGILKSGGKGIVSGGRKTMGGTKAITAASTPMKVVVGKRGVSR